MKTPKSLTAKGKVLAIVLLTFVMLQLSSVKSKAERPVGGDCSTYCYFYNPDYNCVLTYSDGSQTVCWYSNPWGL
jgi:hypothetical protein